MHILFGDVLWAVLALGVLAAIWAMATSGQQWEAYHKRGLFMESAQPTAARPVSSEVAAAERASEIRQMVEASNARRARRGEVPLDVDAEVARLTADPDPDPDPAGTGTGTGTASAPARREADPEVEDEVRALVALRNQRRVRRGEAPLDIEAEVRRELAGLGMTQRSAQG